MVSNQGQSQSFGGGWMVFLSAVGMVIGGVLLLLGGSSAPALRPLPELPAGAPVLTPAFSQSDNLERAAYDAMSFAVLCTSIADAIEFDSQNPPHRLTTGVRLDDFRLWSRHLALRGHSLGMTYPRLPGLVGEYMKKQVGDSGGPLKADVRGKYVQAFRVLALAAERAARELL